LTHVADGCTCLLQHFVAAAAALILMGNAAWRCWWAVESCCSILCCHDLPLLLLLLLLLHLLLLHIVWLWLWLQVTIIMLNVTTASGGVAAAVTAHYHCWLVMQHCTLQHIMVATPWAQAGAAVAGSYCCCVWMLLHAAVATWSLCIKGCALWP